MPMSMVSIPIVMREQRTEERGWQTEGKVQKTEDSGQRSEARSQVKDK
jgi:hypothetical protein